MAFSEVLISAQTGVGRRPENPGLTFTPEKKKKMFRVLISSVHNHGYIGYVRGRERSSGRSAGRIVVHL